MPETVAAPFLLSFFGDAGPMTRRWLPPGLEPWPLCAVDFEASGLPGTGSFPIELAVVHENGRGRSWLIRPEPSWLETICRDESAQAVHGICLELLQAEGIPASVVAWEFARETAACNLVSDYSSAEEEWLAMLNGTAGLPRRRFLDATSDFYEDWIMNSGCMDMEEGIKVLDRLHNAAMMRHPQRHRALPDAMRLMDYLNAVMVEPVPGTANESPAQMHP